MKQLLLLVFATSLVVSCSSPEATPTIATATASLTPTETPALATITRPPPTPSPAPVEGTLSIKVNVRSGPGTGYDSLGQLEAGVKVAILQQDSPGTWYEILYPASAQGTAWVAAEFVTLDEGSVIPQKPTTASSAPGGRVIQRLNVRSGPGTTFESYGMLEADVLVTLTGRNTAGSWYQIEYSGSPGGRGWVTSQYIETSDAAGLPILDEFGKAITPEANNTSSAPYLPPTPTVGAAPEDGDSAAAPAVRVSFSAVGAHDFTYSSLVSAPTGDAEDWVEFIPYASSGLSARLNFSLCLHRQRSIDG